MSREAFLTAVVIGLLVVSVLIPIVPMAVRVCVAVAFGYAVLFSGWRVHTKLDPDANALERFVGACMLAVALVAFSGIVLGHLGVLSSRALLVVGALALLVTKLFVSAAGPVRVIPLPRGREALVLALVTGALLASIIRTGYDLRLSPPGVKSYDDPSYHLSAVATWRSFGDLRMIKFAVGDRSTTFYPIVGELCSFALLAPLDPSDALARYTELPFAFLSMAAIIAIALRLGMSVSAGALAALLFATNPRVFPEIAFSAGTDHVTGFFFLAAVVAALALRGRRTLGNAVLVGVALGLLIGTKYTGFLYAVPLCVLVVTCLYPCTAREASRILSVIVTTAFVLGSYTYVRNLVTTGNPLFPAEVSLFGRAIFSGWVHREHWFMHPQFPINVREFLLHRSDLFGVLFPFIILPAAVLAPVVSFWKTTHKASSMVMFALPILVFLEFRFLMIDHQDARYLFGGLGVACIATLWLIELLADRATTAARVAVMLGIGIALWWQGDPNVRKALVLGMLGAGVLYALCLLGGRSKRRLAIGGSIGSLLLIVLGGGRLLREYDRVRLAGQPVAASLDLETRRRPSTVAYVGSNQPYPFWGTFLQNRVLFVPSFDDLGAAWYSWRSDLLFPHERMSRAAWLRNLERMNVRFVVVERMGHELPELAWLDMDPDRFPRVARDGGTELYAVRPGTVGPPHFGVSADDPHMSTYLVGEWRAQRVKGQEVLLLLDGAGFRVPAFDERPSGIRLDLAPTESSGLVTVRANGAVVGWFRTDGASSVVFATPNSLLELKSITFSIVGVRTTPSGGAAGSAQGSKERPTVTGDASPLLLQRMELFWGKTEVPPFDSGLPVAVDGPAEGSSVPRPLRVRGWCQERGGKPLTPTAFLIDGRLIPLLSLSRTDRPDVGAAIPGLGDVSRAGYTAHLDSSELGPGRHVLIVRFEASDGRYRISEPRPFLIETDR